jgi:glycosyltransferase involved in cell wall biosynthesis
MATRTIRILSVQPVAERGGSDLALLRLARSLPRDQFDVHVVLPAPSPIGGAFREAGVTLHVVPMPRLSTTHDAAAWADYVLRWPFVVRKLARLVRTLDADIVHTNSLHSLYGWAVALLTNRPHVWHAREVVTRSRAALAVERFLCRYFATRVVAVSRAVANQLDPPNVVVLNDVVDPDEFSPARAGRFRVAAGIPDDAPLVGVIARLDPLKGIEVLLDAFDGLRADRPTARLVVVGSAVQGREAYATSVRRRIDAQPGALLVAPRDDIGDVIADLDVLAFPSVEPESYGLVLVEALQSGVPVVATDLGGPVEIVGRARPGAARLVPPADATALRAALAALLPASSAMGLRRGRMACIDTPPPDFAGLFRTAAAVGHAPMRARMSR